uniref:Uncharacterized protein n=1 Tax=viral metagenome TaxID=1070528 RepID=A0A6M3M1K3_9ZZZZ
MNIDFDFISNILGILAFFGIVPNFIRWVKKPNLEVTDVKIITGGVAQIRPGLPKQMTTISWYIKNNKRLIFLGRTVKNITTTFLIDKKVGEGSVWNYNGVRGPIQMIPLGTKTHQLISFERIFPEGEYTLYLTIEEDGKTVATHHENLKV